MRIIMINGSSHVKGTTYVALSEMGKIFKENDIETEIITVGANPIRDCIGCWKCSEKGECIFNDDIVNELTKKIEMADAIVFGSPVYYAHPSGRLLSLLDRLFVSNGKAFYHKVGASICVARRAGTTATLDVLNKYMFDANMVIIGSTYWNMAFGRIADDIVSDTEGLQTLRNLARNMVWAMKCIDLGKGTG